MSIWDYVLWSYFIFTPLYVIFTYKQLRQHVIAEPSLRLKLYSSSIWGLWLPMLLMLGYQSQSPEFAPTVIMLGSINSWGIAFGTLLLGVIGYMVWSLKKLRAETDKDQQLLQGIEPIRWLLPETKKEMKRFVLLVSPSAGICEEILYRGLLLGFLLEHLSVSNAVIISSIAFGLPHLYQGLSGLIKTAVLGSIMAIVTVLTESLILAIILHSAIDMYMGLLSYIVINRQPRSFDSETNLVSKDLTEADNL